MTDIERAADYIGRLIVVGFSTKEDQQKAQGIVDEIAADVLDLPEVQRSEAGEGLRAVIGRLQEHCEKLAMRAMTAESEARKAEVELLHLRTAELLSKFGKADEALAQRIIDAAERHAFDSETDHEVGDLQGAVRMLVSLLTKRQQEKAQAWADENCWDTEN